MKIFSFILTLLLLSSCEDIGIIIKDDKLKQDVQELAQDTLEIGEQVIEDETGVKVEIELPKN